MEIAHTGARGAVTGSGITGGLLRAVGGRLPAATAAAAAAEFVSMGQGVRGGRLAVVAPLRVGVAVGRRRAPTRPAPFSVVCYSGGSNGGSRGAASGGRRRLKVNWQTNPPNTAESSDNDDPKRTSALKQALRKALEYLTRSMPWRAILGLLLWSVCTVVGYYGAKGDQRVIFVIDVLDKANNTYKPVMEFAVLAAKFFVSFIKSTS